MNDDTLHPFDLSAVQRKKLTVDFYGGNQSSDAGLLLLRQAERKLGVCQKLADAMSDRRKAEFANFERQTLRTITAEQKRQIRQLARDFPRLWTAPSTEARDRKRMLRLLIKDITVAKGREPKLLRLQIRWQGGAT